MPADWVIDGIDQLAQLVGPQDSFGRELVVLALCLSKPVSDAQGASIGGVRNDKRSSP